MMLRFILLLLMLRKSLPQPIHSLPNPQHHRLIFDTVYKTIHEIEQQHHVKQLIVNPKHQIQSVLLETTRASFLEPTPAEELAAKMAKRDENVIKTVGVATKLYSNLFPKGSDTTVQKTDATLVSSKCGGLCQCLASELLYGATDGALPYKRTFEVDYNDLFVEKINWYTDANCRTNKPGWPTCGKAAMQKEFDAKFKQKFIDFCQNKDNKPICSFNTFQVVPDAEPMYYRFHNAENSKGQGVWQWTQNEPGELLKRCARGDDRGRDNSAVPTANKSERQRLLPNSPAKTHKKLGLGILQEELDNLRGYIEKKDSWYKTQTDSWWNRVLETKFVPVWTPVKETVQEGNLWAIGSALGFIETDIVDKFLLNILNLWPPSFDESETIPIGSDKDQTDAKHDIALCSIRQWPTDTAKLKCECRHEKCVKDIVGSYFQLSQLQDRAADHRKKKHVEFVYNAIGMGLDVLGLIDPFGMLADILNAGLSALQGKVIEAILSVVAITPIMGWIFAPFKWIFKGILDVGPKMKNWVLKFIKSIASEGGAMVKLIDFIGKAISKSEKTTDLLKWVAVGMQSIGNAIVYLAKEGKRIMATLIEKLNKVALEGSVEELMGAQEIVVNFLTKLMVHIGCGKSAKDNKDLAITVKGKILLPSSAWIPDLVKKMGTTLGFVKEFKVVGQWVGLFSPCLTMCSDRTKAAPTLQSCVKHVISSMVNKLLPCVKDVAKDVFGDVIKTIDKLDGVEHIQKEKKTEKSADPKKECCKLPSGKLIPMKFGECCPDQPCQNTLLDMPTFYGQADSDSETCAESIWSEMTKELRDKPISQEEMQKTSSDIEKMLDDSLGNQQECDPKEIEFALQYDERGNIDEKKIFDSEGLGEFLENYDDDAGDAGDAGEELKQMFKNQGGTTENEEDKDDNSSKDKKNENLTMPNSCQQEWQQCWNDASSKSDFIECQTTTENKNVLLIEMEEESYDPDETNGPEITSTAGTTENQKNNNDEIDPTPEQLAQMGRNEDGTAVVDIDFDPLTVVDQMLVQTLTTCWNADKNNQPVVGLIELEERNDPDESNEHSENEDNSAEEKKDQKVIMDVLWQSVGGDGETCDPCIVAYASKNEDIIQKCITSQNKTVADKIKTSSGVVEDDSLRTTQQELLKEGNAIDHKFGEVGEETTIGIMEDTTETSETSKGVFEDDSLRTTQLNLLKEGNAIDRKFGEVGEIDVASVDGTGINTAATNTGDISMQQQMLRGVATRDTLTSVQKDLYQEGKVAEDNNVMSAMVGDI